MSEKKKIPLGTSDFKKIITENRYYVDKSLFIKDVVNGMDVLLFPRPRRFGKTLNLSMLKYFYDPAYKDSGLFDGLKISSEPDIMKKHGKHPVIYITFKDVKFRTWEDCLYYISDIISHIINSFRYILDSEHISEMDKDFCRQIVSKKTNTSDFANSLKILSRLLYQYHQAKPVILIDEYDTPIHEGYFHHFYDEVISFMRVFLSATLKDNEYLEKAVLTGILRTSKESMFSGLNNIEVCSITSIIAADKIGFTESEVIDLLDYYDGIFALDEIKYWYDGYNFGKVEIYNPWSILSSIRQENLSVHWVNTSGNDLVKELCLSADESVKQDIDILAQGGSIHKAIDDNIVFANLGKDNDLLWSFLLHSGYLRYDNAYLDHAGVRKADLSIPNFEISCIYRNDIAKHWFTPPRESKQRELSRIMTNLYKGDINIFKEDFLLYCSEALSYYDVSKKEPEKQYHMLLLGMLMCLKDKYYIRSNREVGLGRCDVMLIPRDLSQVSRGIIFELKRVNKALKETFECVIDDALYQITDNKYNTELRSHGVKDIVNIILVFSGKNLRVVIP